MLPPILIRNLIYHCYPASDAWMANIDRLRPHDGVFNGRRIISVATDDKTATVDEVAERLGWERVEWRTVANDPRLCEVASMPTMLRAVASTNWNEATFYGHAKGIAPGGDPRGARRWRNMMYHHLLDRADECIDALQFYAAVGTNRLIHAPGRSPWPTGLTHGSWQYAGTFFWFRHDAVFTNPCWSYVPQEKYGSEAWIGGIVPYEQSYTMFQPLEEQCRPFPARWIYDPNLYPAEFD